MVDSDPGDVDGLTQEALTDAEEQIGEGGELTGLHHANPDAAFNQAVAAGEIKPDAPWAPSTTNPNTETK